MEKGIVKKIISGDRRAAAKLITLVEDDFKQAENILKNLYNYTGNAFIVGITGPPGSGKSTITYKLTKTLRKKGKKVAIIAIDPTSPFTGGALLGDRIRMQDLSMDKDVFIRSMGTRGYLGGLSRATQSTIKILDALGKDIIFIETVGVGQAEVDIVTVADTVVLVTVPGMGDDIQINKAGIMEIGDIFVVNKADKEGYERLMTEINMMLDLNNFEKWHPPVVKTIALDNLGIENLLYNINLHLKYLKDSGQFKKRRHKNIKKEMLSLIQEEWKNLLTDSINNPYLEKITDKIEKRKIDPYTSVQKILNLLIKSYKQGGNLSLIEKIDHIGIAVKDIEKACDVFDKLNIKVAGKEVVEEQKVKVAFLPIGDSELELLESTSPDGPIAKFIEKKGEGIQHIAFRVSNLDEILEKCKKEGVRLIDEKPRYGAGGARIAFLHPKSTNGILIELCER